MRPLFAIPCILTLVVVLAAGPAPAEAARLAVTAPLANIRGGPGTDYEVLWQVERYFPFEVIDRSGSWIFFQDFEGDRGWIHDSLVGDIPAVITKAPTSNVRSGPGTDYDIRLQVDFGVPFRVLDRKGEWLHVEHADGEKGWIHQSLIW
ncbi:MAG: SH3 domain-containing protein [Desulfobacterales bacterium]|jgi:SH3-like domain-containing protein